MKIGVLAVQGAFAEHITTLKKLDIDTRAIRLPNELADIDGLVIPGGESTAIIRLMNAYDLVETIRSRAKTGMPVFGTCAGMILLAKHIIGNGTPTLHLMDIKVRRNAFGRQVDSFESDVIIPELGQQPFPCIFIRAPLIEQCDSNVEILGRLADDTIVAAKQDNFLVTAFHPELTKDTRIHQLFARMVAENS